MARARLRGIPLSPIVVRSVAAPFTGGLVTDMPSWMLAPNQTPNAADAIFPKGVAVPRGAYVQASASGVLVNSASHWLTGVIAADLPSYGGASGQPTAPVICGAAEDGTIGILAGSPSGSAGVYGLFGGTGTPTFPREIYKGEVLFCVQDGITPICRFAGAPAGSLTANGTAAGTVSQYQGTSFVLGINTTFSTQARVGTYLQFTGFTGSSSLVVAVDDDTHLSLDSVWPITTGTSNLITIPDSGGWASGGATSRFGTIGLCTPVQTLGQASISTGLGATVSGFGTLWNTANTPPGHGRPRVGDYIGTRGSFDRMRQIATITNDYTITMNISWAGIAPDHPNAPYVIYRNAVGREARYHQGRLYITGVDWDDTGVYYLPVNAPLGIRQNTDQPTATITSDYAVSQCMLKFDVPIAGALGKNIALLSTPQGLLILRSDGAYLSMGDPPTNTVIELARGAGCVHILSACVGNRGEGAFWCGQNGIYRYTGGRVVDLTAGRRNREWRQKMVTFMADAIVSTGAAFCSCAVQDSHLLVAVYDTITSSINSLWVYDLINDVWCPNFSTDAAGISSMSMYRSSSLKNSAPDDVYFTIQGTLGTLNRGQAVRMGGVCRDEGNLGTSALYGSFSCDLPESVVGAPDDLTRVIEAKLVYELTGGDGTTALVLQSGVDGGAVSEDGRGSANSSGPQEIRIMPVTDVTGPGAGGLGKLARRHSHRLIMTGTKPTSMRVHQIDLVVRPRRPRA